MNLLTPYWLYIKIGLIMLLCGLCSLLTYNYQSNKYEKKLLEIKNAQYSAIAEATNKAIEKEQVNQETTQRLEREYLAKAEKLRLENNALRSSIDKYNGLRFPTTSCVQTNPTNSTTSGAASESPNTTGQQCQLSRASSEAIVTIAEHADELANRLNVCLDYAANINKQREEMMKEDK